jgi:hypothetical protein
MAKSVQHETRTNHYIAVKTASTHDPSASSGNRMSVLWRTVLLLHTTTLKTTRFSAGQCSSMLRPTRKACRGLRYICWVPNRQEGQPR